VEQVRLTGSIFALVVLCWLVLSAVGLRRRPEAVFAVTALALLTLPVAKTLQLGEVDLIVAALVGVDLLPRRNDNHWWQGIATGAGGRDQAHSADLRGLPPDYPAHEGRSRGSRNVRRDDHRGFRFAAIAVPGILAGGSVSGRAPGRQSG